MLAIYFDKRSKDINFQKVGTYSIPLIPNDLAWWVINASDRMVISQFYQQLRMAFTLLQINFQMYL